ncbi:hypothetical protein [Streptomyces sp. NBC_00829]|nr:hypothetical protein OG293_37510 [Streptomyces sp. NBC_00829]
MEHFLTPATYICDDDQLKTLPLALAGFTSVNGTSTHCPCPPQSS